MSDACGLSQTTLIVIAKRPVAGRVKTRLVPPLTDTDAADIAAAALRDTIRAVTATPAADRLLAFDGDSSGWVSPGWTACVQPRGGLDVRLCHAFASVAPDRPALLVGMDTPQLRPEHLLRFDPSRYDACLGLAVDGGYWAIGFRNPASAASTIAGVPMSTSTTGAEQLRRLVASGLRVQMLDVLTDVDTIDAAETVAAQAPDTAFATALASTRDAVAQAG